MVASVTFPVSVILRMTDMFSGPLGKSSGKLAGFNKRLGDTGRRLTTGLSLPLGLMGLAAVKATLSWEMALKRIRAKASFTADEMGRIQKKIQAIALESKFTPSEVATGASALAASLSETDLIKVLKPAVELAIVGEMDIETLGVTFADLLNVTKTPADKFEEVADAMTLGMSRTTSTLEGLFSGIANTISVANELSAGISANQLIFAAAISKSGSGGDESRVGTQLFRFLGDLADTKFKNNALSAAFLRFGFSPRDVFTEDGNVDIVRFLSKVESLDKTSQSQIKAAFTDKRPQKGFQALLSGSVNVGGKKVFGSQAIQALMSELVTETGITSRKAEDFMEGLGGAIDRLRTQSQMTGKDGISPLKNELIELTDSLTASMKWLSNQSAPFQSNVANITAGLIVLPLALRGLSFIAQPFIFLGTKVPWAHLVGGIAQFGVFLASLVTPLGAVVIGTGLLVAAAEKFQLGVIPRGNPNTKFIGPGGIPSLGPAYEIDPSDGSVSPTSTFPVGGSKKETLEHIHTIRFQHAPKGMQINMDSFMDSDIGFSMQQ